MYHQINQPDKSKTYLKRTGAYALLLNAKDLLAIVKTDTGYFLPGGGIENNELLEECLIRECIEEIGIKIEIKAFLGSVNYFFYSTTFNTDMESDGYFYKCSISEILNISTEMNHDLIWAEKEEAYKLLFLESQKFAVLKFL